MKIYHAVRRTGLPNFIKARIPVPSALNIPAWRTLLKDYHDTTLVDLLCYGWPADYTADYPPTPTYKNHVRDPAVVLLVADFVKTEMAHKAIFGPFETPPFTPWTQVSPIMTKPKRGSSKHRIIVDLSCPRGKSVNSGIVRGSFLGACSRYTLPGIMDVAELIKYYGQGSYLWSGDLSRAYRQMRACQIGRASRRERV